ncbi:hypothetical protein Cantr_08764 [Candida viswanathii]|uniref:Uncharacterized protein n=1 Tax=Candida viswanathii TaxID=5486 RepID=A0A367Y3Z4_9ASCO|nr:hypothetical protein Cantr_04882 [Candida viswanathii]RCK60557.1 hypothetical protein Cantr_08764 [Candida viswanathii]
MIKYIITSNINNTLKQLLPRLAKLTYINSTEPTLLLTIPGLDHQLINYEYFTNLQQIIDCIQTKSEVIVIENLLKYNLDEHLLVELFRKLSDLEYCYIIDNRKIGFIELMTDDVVLL